VDGPSANFSLDEEEFRPDIILFDLGDFFSVSDDESEFILDLENLVASMAGRIC